MMDTHQVLNQHIDAMLQRNLELIMSDYTEDSIIVTPDGRITGLEGIRKMFKRFFSAIPADAELSIDKQYAEEQYAYIVWNASSQFLEIPMGTDTMVVENGKIVFQTYAGLMQVKK